MAARALVLGSGGLAGVAWEVGVLKSLQDRGLDIEHWDVVVGSSAGAFVGAWLASGRFDELFAAEAGRDPAVEERKLAHALGGGLPRSFRLARRGHLAAAPALWTLSVAVRCVFREARTRGGRSAADAVGAVRAMASGSLLGAADVIRVGRLASTNRHPVGRWFDYWAARLAPLSQWPTTRLVTVAVDGESALRIGVDAKTGVALTEAVAASAAIPMVVPHVLLRGHTMLDGGSLSTTNADMTIDLVPGLEEVLIIAPGDRGTLAGEVSSLRARSVHVTVVQPPPGSEYPGSGLRVLDTFRVSESLRQGLRDGLGAAPPA